ncbi:MAG: sulfite exporter TauE/SafE family protein, partial [Candidatus Hermodarchaeota archaeon]
MALELYQAIILIGVGALVGISISLAGQTGQGVVLPIVLLFTGNVFLAIAVNLLNDFITSLVASIKYVRNREYKIRLDIFLIIFIAIIISFFSVLILLSTALNTIFGWFIPAFIVCLGLFFIKQGFPTSESLKKITDRFKNKAYIKSQIKIPENKSKENLKSENTPVEQKFSKIFILLALFFGAFIGINSGLFGAASGLIFVIALVIIYGYPLKKSVGTALILSMIICLSTFILYMVLGLWIKKQIFFNLQISLFLAIGSIPTAII